MLWAVDYQQHLDPLARFNLPWSSVWSTLFAALPVLVLFYLLVPRRWLAPWAGLAAAVCALVVAVTGYAMPVVMAFMAFVHGAAFGILPVGWTIFTAMLLYNVTVQTGKFDLVRRSVAGLSGDARLQAILIAFAFGAFLEGAAGGGTPVAICGAILVGLGFDPFRAAVICLIANTSPVAYGGLGTPIITLEGVTGLDSKNISVMAGHQLPLISLFIPLYMVVVLCGWRRTLQVWPALLVAGGSFAAAQFAFSTCHVYVPSLVLYPMTDVAGGIFSLVVTAAFLRFWKPKSEWHFGKKPGAAVVEQKLDPKDPHEAAAMARLACEPPRGPEEPLTLRSVALAWAPFVLMSVLLMLSGIAREREGRGPLQIGPVQSKYVLPLPFLHKNVARDPELSPVTPEQLAVLASVHDGGPLQAAVDTELAVQLAPKPEAAEFNFIWLTAPGSAVFLSAVLSMLMLRMNRRQVASVFRVTCRQMKIPIPTIALMLGLSYVTRYAGMDATLGVAFAHTGAAYPFFAPILGWLGVFLTGTDAGSNALFGSLQKITATRIHSPAAFPHLGLEQTQTLICTANSTGGVMGKMIDAQSIVVATAATNQLGREADIFKAVVWHSIVLACVVGLLCLLQAYVWPFTAMVP
jgi:lactate permease